MLEDKRKRLVEKKIRQLEIQGRITGTWELIKEKNFHLNSDLLVIERQELRDLVLEAINEILANPSKSNE